LAETPSVSPSSAKTTAAVVVIVAFIAGLLAGVAGDRFYLIRTRQFFPHRAMEFAARRVVDHLDRELHLNAQQRVEIQGIIDRHRAHMDSIMSGVRPQMRQEIDAANAEIEKVLTPAQRVQFSNMRMHMRARHGIGSPR
jgi:hypothetical protein